MRNFLFSERIKLNPDQDIAEVKSFLEETLSQVIELKEISTSSDHFYVKGSTGGLFDFIRKAKIFVEFDFIVEKTKTDKELRVFVKGNTALSLSMAFSYLFLFSLILFAGLLPGSIETGSENSSALDALVFLVIGYYIKTEIDRSLIESEQHIIQSVKTLKTRFEI